VDEIWDVSGIGDAFYVFASDGWTWQSATISAETIRI
jgi:hypothetical protein